MVVCTMLCSQTAEICRSHSQEMGVTTITSNHDVPMVGQPTTESPDAYSRVNTTEKAVEIKEVDESLPISQRNIDSRLISVNPRDAIAPQRDETRKNEEPHYWLDMNPQDLDLDFNADEELSSKASVEKRFDKMEFLNVFPKAVNNVITHMIMKVAEESQSSKCSQQLCVKNVMPPPPKIHDTNSFARQNSINSHQTLEMDNLIVRFTLKLRLC